MNKFILTSAFVLAATAANADIISIHAGQAFGGYIDGPYDSTGPIPVPRPYITENNLPPPPSYDWVTNLNPTAYRIELRSTGYLAWYGICNIPGCGGYGETGNLYYLTAENNEFWFDLSVYNLVGSYSFDRNDITASVNLPQGFHVRDIDVAAVPEPSTWALMILGFLGIAGMGVRRNNKPPATKGQAAGGL